MLSDPGAGTVVKGVWQQFTYVFDNGKGSFYKNGKLAVLTLWAPLGADNVDQWQRMSQSFKWLSK